MIEQLLLSEAFGRLFLMVCISGNVGLFWLTAYVAHKATKMAVSRWLTFYQLNVEHNLALSQNRNSAITALKQSADRILEAVERLENSSS